MKRKLFLYSFMCLLSVCSILVWAQNKTLEDRRIISFIVNPATKKIKLYWKDNSGKRLGSIQGLKTWLYRKGERLQFAMNAGMYKPDYSPVGLYIEAGKTLSALDTTSGSGNFYLKPNGVFYIKTDNNAFVCNTGKFRNSRNIQFATQSGPMLVANSKIHSAFTKGSANKTVRNGVGILPDGSVVFAISKEPVNFYDFAEYFKNKGCENALYLDGFVSRMYLPQENWIQTDGNFGVMIGISSNNK